MATEQVLGMNGDYAPHAAQYHPYAGHQMSVQAQINNPASVNSAPAPGAFGSQHANVPSKEGQASPGGNAQQHSEIPKDEVGWYFVEQYYTNLSRSPERLHLFYNKPSQFVSGDEAEKAPVYSGRSAIAKRIRELDFHDCKVRVSNVDSQSSYNNIVIQVIGELSNRSAPHRKYAQTFVLAEQPNGYFVLNDIFRYLSDETDDEEIDTPAEDTVSEPQAASSTTITAQDAVSNPGTTSHGLTSSTDPATQHEGAEQVDQQIEQKVLTPQKMHPNHSTQPNQPNHSSQVATPSVNGTSSTTHAGSTKDTTAPEPDEVTKDAAVPDQAAKAAAIEDVQPDKPADPVPSPTHTPAQPTQQAPVQQAPAQQTSAPPAAAAPAPAPAPKPAVPKTWANLVAGSQTTAAAAVATPPSSTTSSSTPTNNHPKSAPTTNGQPQHTTAHVNANANAGANASANSGWQTAGTDNSKRQNRPHSTSVARGDGEVHAYIKHVTEKVTPEALRSALGQFGELAYLDISRQKNCAFVDFADHAGYTAAVNANPHSISGEQIYVEERRPRASAHGNANYGGGGSGRGGVGRGRGDRPGQGGQGRGSFQKEGGGGGGGRGGFGGRGGRGGNPSRGRGGNAQAS